MFLDSIEDVAAEDVEATSDKVSDEDIDRMIEAEAQAEHEREMSRLGGLRAGVKSRVCIGSGSSCGSHGIGRFVGAVLVLFLSGFFLERVELGPQSAESAHLPFVLGLDLGLDHSINILVADFVRSRGDVIGGDVLDGVEEHVHTLFHGLRLHHGLLPVGLRLNQICLTEELADLGGHHAHGAGEVRRGLRLKQSTTRKWIDSAGFEQIGLGSGVLALLVGGDALVFETLECSERSSH